MWRETSASEQALQPISPIVKLRHKVPFHAGTTGALMEGRQWEEPTDGNGLEGPGGAAMRAELQRLWLAGEARMPHRLAKLLSVRVGSRGLGEYVIKRQGWLGVERVGGAATGCPVPPAVQATRPMYSVCLAV